MNEKLRGLVVVGNKEPATEAGRLMHEEWHGGEEFPGAPRECGELGCGFLGRILAVEDAAAKAYFHDWSVRLRDALAEHPGNRQAVLSAMQDEIAAAIRAGGSADDEMPTEAAFRVARATRH